ncbi:hypothetical protein [Altibacter sp. HG106]|uniref:hypothetical protein n=1 Tax=Altibacter sp. HG106 TaxID=3023937 RepID=UPI00234FC7F5|nr:hypothetical protein [Altibacter sp. HG106]MDC7995314.1 hypothetical protein [Altibacter sp. HG106]
MRTKILLMVVLLSIVLLGSCKSTSTAPLMGANTNTNIIGSWEGCDGRVVTFFEEDSEIIGRYTELGGLTRYRFTENEVGYRLTEQQPGQYLGMVKWQDQSGNETWKKVSITIKNNTYNDNSSDNCSKDMKRI